jgi:hypothetical protein
LRLDQTRHDLRRPLEYTLTDAKYFAPAAGQAFRLRAITQIGKISRELEKAQAGRHPKEILPDGRKDLTKEEQLEAAGIKTSTANEYEQLAASVVGKP